MTYKELFTFCKDHNVNIQFGYNSLRNEYTITMRRGCRQIIANVMNNILTDTEKVDVAAKEILNDMVRQLNDFD